MSYQSTTGLDLITGALRKINALEAGETPNAADTADALQVMNDMLENWSAQKLNVFAQVENILYFTPGTYEYTIGNPTGGTCTGTLISGSSTISGVTIPSNMTVGGTLTDIQGAIPSGTTIASFNSSAGTITMSSPATFTVASAETITYTVPGNFAIPRPLRITNAFTRITASSTTSLDYPIDFEGGRDKYVNIGIKGLPGPWPIVGWYNPTYPYGTLYFYPNPQQSGELHLFTDTLFSDFSVPTQAISLPQGYAHAIKCNLALLLAPEYGKNPTPLLVEQAKSSMEVIKKLNSTPAVQATYDRDIVRATRNDAGWIMHGGFA